MSGYKLAAISITTEEYDRLYESQKEIQAIPEPSGELMDFVGSQSATILQANLEEMQSRQEALDAMLSDVSESIRDIEQNTSQALVEFETGVVTQAEQYIGAMWQHFDQVIGDYYIQFDQQIKANAQETQENIAELYRHLRQMAASAGEKQELALEWLQAADGYCAFIKQYFHYEQFIPGRVEWLERQLFQAHQNIEAGLPEVVIASAQQLVLAFSDLRVELERLQNEWVLLYQAAWEAANRLLIQVDDCQFIEAVDLEGNLIQSKIDVDYWGDGKLNRLYANILAIRDQMEDGQNQPDREMLLRWLDTVLPEYRSELESIIFQARITVLNSQLRINIADLVIRAMQEQGFALAESDYAQNDMRNAYGACLTNLEGNQVIVQVAPVGENIGENELHVQSMDSEQRTERELEQRWYEISRSLNHYGVEVSPYTRLDQDAPRNKPNIAYPGYLVNKKTNHSGMKTSRTHGYRTSPPDHPQR